MTNVKYFVVTRVHDIVTVMLLPHKDGSGYSFINLSKGHICQCKFQSIEDAIDDMRRKADVVSFREVPLGVTECSH